MSILYKHLKKNKLNLNEFPFYKRKFRFQRRHFFKKKIKSLYTYKQKIKIKQRMFSYFNKINNRYLKKELAATTRSDTNGVMAFFYKLGQRLDVVLWSCGVAHSLASARQIIIHNRIFINNKLVTAPAHLLNYGDIIRFKNFKGLINVKQLMSSRSKRKKTSLKYYKLIASIFINRAYKFKKLNKFKYIILSPLLKIRTKSIFKNKDMKKRRYLFTTNEQAKFYFATRSRVNKLGAYVAPTSTALNIKWLSIFNSRKLLRHPFVVADNVICALVYLGDHSEVRSHLSNYMKK